MNQTNKEVDFASWCKKCKHRRCSEDEEPCRECLDVPGREDSHKPIKWEEKR